MGPDVRVGVRRVDLMIDVMWAADDKKAILLDFHGQWDLHMLKLACKRAGYMLRAHEQRTHLILDFSENN